MIRIVKEIPETVSELIILSNALSTLKKKFDFPKEEQKTEKKEEKTKTTDQKK